jgi:DNA-binding transcriptional MocR family regulator
MSGFAVQPISTTEAVIASLRARILDGKIEPGVRLPEVELAMEFGVARPTVRAAIQTLCHEGLLVRPNAWTCETASPPISDDSSAISLWGARSAARSGRARTTRRGSCSTARRGRAAER